MTYSSAVLALNPIRYYKFAESSGTTAIDSSSAGVNGAYGPGSGTWTGGTLGAVGAVAEDTAATFTGGYVDIGDLPADGATAFTVVGWVKVQTAGGYRAIFSKFDSNFSRYEISLGNSSEYGTDLGLVVSVNNASPYTAAILATGEWAHLAVVYDGTQATNADRVKVYVNADQKAMTAGGTIPASLPTLAEAGSTIASRSDGTTNWVGGLDDFALFNSALSASQIADLYSANGGGSATLTTAVVQASGSQIALTFDAATTAFASDLAVSVGGYPVPVSNVSGAGTSWTAKLGVRWIRAGQAVSVTYQGGTPVTATNSSGIVDRQVAYVGQRFGMFVHYGIETYTNAEWALPSVSVDTFSPTGNISTGVDSWIAGALTAGMKYVTLTAKHHNGFCLWPSAASTRTVAQTAWYAANGSPDIVRIFTEKARAAGLGVCLYYSIWDRWWEANVGGTSAQYQDFAEAQLTELLTNYGAIDALWFDGWGWIDSTDDVTFAEIPWADIKAHCNALQPQCLLIVNSHDHTLATTDIAVHESPLHGGVPADNVLPTEVCDTIRADNKWFWGTAADAGKTASALKTTRDTTNARQATYLLNCPPDLTGALPAATLLRLAEIGASDLESVPGISTSAGTLAQRTVSVTLTTNGTTPAANLSGLRWAWWDQATPDMTRPPRAQGTGETTDASGVLSISVPSSLPVSGVGWLVVTNSAGNPAADHNAFSGPVAVS